MKEKHWKKACRKIMENKENTPYRVRYIPKPLHIYAFSMFFDELIERYGDGRIWAGEHTELLRIMKRFAGIGRFYKMVPKSAIHLSRIIRLMIPELEFIGFKIDYYRGRRRLINIQRLRQGIKKILYMVEEIILKNYGKSIKTIDMKTFFQIYDAIRRKEKEQEILEKLMKM